MLSFFKKKVPLAEYCNTILNTIFSEEMTIQLMRIKNGIPDSALSQAGQPLYLNEMRGAYLQLFSIVITKQCNDMQISMDASRYFDTYLSKKFGSQDLRNVSDAYNKAFGSSPSDGVMEMAKLLSLRLGKDELSQGTIEAFRELFYTFLSSTIHDLEKVKIVN